VRQLYLLISYVAAPFVALVLIWKGFGNREYFERFEERFGFGRTRVDSDSIWVHAVSVGEVTAATPLIRRLMAAHPGTPVVVTTVTPTGAQRVADLFGDTVVHSYAPYDMPGSVARFFERMRPKIAVIMETELWPNLWAECGKRDVPLVLANARVSPRSMHRYRRFVGLFRWALSYGIVIAAQSEADAERFLSLGSLPERTRVVGNIKFDYELPEGVDEEGRTLRQSFGADRPVWIAASTHAGEETMALDAARDIGAQVPGALLLLVPRHPKRFGEVEGILRNSGARYVTRSSGASGDSETDVFFGNTLGELLVFYAAADVAFVGGSLVPIGGHNLLEPAALGRPVLTGPHNFNAEDVAQIMVEEGGATLVEHPADLAGAVLALLNDETARAAQGERARQAVVANRGSLDRLMALLEPLIS
jgi:3-deoxy-D-manno-octulosonic-acid transferase